MHNIKHFVFNVECDSKVKTCIIYILFTREPQMQTHKNNKKYQLDDMCVCVCESAFTIYGREFSLFTLKFSGDRDSDAFAEWDGVIVWWWRTEIDVFVCAGKIL